MNEFRKILLGSIGGDSHSVGLIIIREALRASGWNVHFLGVQNSLDDFFENAAGTDLVMISSLDGHAWHYLKEFPDYCQKFNLGDKSPLWFLGGNLTIGDSVRHEEQFRQMGFDEVFVKPVDIEVVLDLVKRRMASRNNNYSSSDKKNHESPLLNVDAVPAGEVLEKSFILKERKIVLEHWSTGFGARSLEDNAKFLLNSPSFVTKQKDVLLGNENVLTQPRSGVELVDAQIALFKSFAHIGAKVLSFQIDSLTRNNSYALASEAINHAKSYGDCSLNGFPLINHGVTEVRRIVRNVGVPIQVRHSTRDPRLLAEISLAGGCTGFEGGSICYNIPYYKDYKLTDSIHNWQYVDRLVGIYFKEYGVRIDREFFGVLTGTLIPPCLAIVTCVLESVLAVQQGVKSVSVGYAEQGNRVQDIAAIRALETITHDVLANLGYGDVQVNTVFHQYMAAFPTIPSKAESLILNSAITGKMSGATRIMVKTPVESYKIPSVKDNLEGLALVQKGVNKAIIDDIKEVYNKKEFDLICDEVYCILDKIVLCGNGSMTEGIVKGFHQGYIDIPFAPSQYNKGQVLCARDTKGAIRFINTGNIPFDKNIKEFHRHKMSERRKKEGLLAERLNYRLIEKDVLQISRGQYSSWPLDLHNDYA